MSVEIDIYGSINKETWESREKEIMSYSIDGCNYHDNEGRTDENVEWNINIRVYEENLDKLGEIIHIMDAKLVENEEI